jgi:HlyD family secretion protein
MKKYWLIAIPIVGLLLWWGFDHGESAPQIHFATVKKVTIESTVPTNGKVEPATWAASRAETAGVVTSIAVQRGQQVQAGQTLVKLDPTSAQSALAAAWAALEEARAQNSILARGGKDAAVADLNNRIKTAQNAVEVAQRIYDADVRLQQQQAVTQLQTQQAKDELERAKLLLTSLEDQKRTLVTSSDRAVAQAKLHDAEAAVALARHRVSLTEIKAPLSGTLYQFDLKVGAYLQVGELVGLIGDLDQMKVAVYVDEPDLGRVSMGVPVNISWDARPGQTWRGHVDKLPTEVIALGTRTVGEVNTIVDNPNHDLLPGVTVNVTIISKVVKDALSIPKAALRTLRGETGAYKLSGNQIAWTPIQAGVSDVNNVQVVSGLNLTDRVADRVIEPSDAEIRDGMRVKAALD